MAKSSLSCYTSGERGDSPLGEGKEEEEGLTPSPTPPLSRNGGTQPRPRLEEEEEEGLFLSFPFCFPHLCFVRGGGGDS